MKKLIPFANCKVNYASPLRDDTSRRRERLRLMYSPEYTTSSSGVLVVGNKFVVRPWQDRHNNRHCHVNGPRFNATQNSSLFGFFVVKMRIILPPYPYRLSVDPRSRRTVQDTRNANTTGYMLIRWTISI